MPERWPTLYAKLSESKSPSIVENATALALLFGDPQALVSLRKQTLARGAPAAERQVALAMLLEKGTPELAPMLATCFPIRR